MKKLIALILTAVFVLAALTSCVQPPDTGTSTDTDEGQTTVTEETEKETVPTEESKSESNTETEKEPGNENKKAVLVSFKTEASDYNGPFNSTVGWTAAGMGYIIKTKSGKVIAIDGGNTADAAPFYEQLKKYTADNGGVVDYWILTHPHGDHINALITMVNMDMFKLKLNNLIYDFPLDFSDSGCGQNNRKMKVIAGTLGANIITPQKGMKITVDDVQLDFLYTPVDYGSYTSSNYISLIFTVKAENKKVMITGDAFEPSLKAVANEYKEALKCDILQMPHHFLCDTGYEAFYNYVGADTLILPTCRAGFVAMTDPESEYRGNSKYKLNKRVLEAAKKYYLAYDGTVEIEL